MPYINCNYNTNGYNSIMALSFEKDSKIFYKKLIEALNVLVDTSFFLGYGEKDKEFNWLAKEVAAKVPNSNVLVKKYFSNHTDVPASCFLDAIKYLFNDYRKFNDFNALSTDSNNENYLSINVGGFLYCSLLNKEDMYWSFANGVSTFYGGYVLSLDTIRELKLQFLEELLRNPHFNFLVEFRKGRKLSVNNHFSHYVKSAFLYEEVIKKKGFEDILELVYSGVKGELFFDNLNRILNIDKDNFNHAMLN
ncbi:hypothetical protein [Yeosuana marina]|uniref:hypothetical protein n=1 Tax=Yeosuana marina TaxID=1565536 RepID=UPI00141DF62D|nr:hypothetical protein [Yeosuana marina]